jgi:tRNA pseudouridine65 synthase
MHRTALAAEQDAFLVDRLRERLARRLYPVHRLDRATSGVVVLALDPVTAAGLAAQFEARAVEKSYLAVVRGWLPDAGHIDHAIADRDDPAAGRRGAVTDFRCLATAEIDAAIEKYPRSRFSLGLLHPRTGRRHQLRRHMKHISHPIIGDTTYGRGPYNRYFREQVLVHRLLLHAWQLAFRHPEDGRSMTLTAPVEGVFLDVIDRFGWAGALCAVGEVGSGVGELDP